MPLSRKGPHAWQINEGSALIDINYNKKKYSGIWKRKKKRDGELDRKGGELNGKGG